MKTKMEIKIRKARRSDAKEILRLIIELAEFEKLSPPGIKEQNRLIKHAFSENPYYRILLALNDGKVIAYAFYYFTYSSFLAKRTLYLEDIYVCSAHRGSGAGKLLMNKLISIAHEEKCGRMEWIVLDWNKKAINFYERLGAKEMKEWKLFRFNFHN
ncbi:MAG: GNAT family N-acetyltransferase [Ignavibacteriae bacterium]|nr:GNAT family N-acetyltransferase [Ignavibacteriota bacterium]